MVRLTKSKKRNVKLFAVFIIILASSAGWAFYSFLNEIADIGLEKLGIDNSLMRMAVIFISIFIILVIAGLGVGKAFREIIE